MTAIMSNSANMLNWRNPVIVKPPTKSQTCLSSQMAVSNQTLLFRILLRTGDQLRGSNWCSLFDDLVPLVDGSLGLTCLKLIFHRHQVSYVKTMYICCWPTYLSCVRSGDTIQIQFCHQPFPDTLILTQHRQSTLYCSSIIYKENTTCS